MAHYTFILFDGGRVLTADTIMATNDQRAIARATEICEAEQDSTGFEIWQENRKVCTHSKRPRTTRTGRSQSGELAS